MDALLRQEHPGDVVARLQNGGDVRVIGREQRSQAVGERDEDVEQVLVVGLLGVERRKTSVDLRVEVVEVARRRGNRLGEFGKGLQRQDLCIQGPVEEAGELGAGADRGRNLRTFALRSLCQLAQHGREVGRVDLVQQRRRRREEVAELVAAVGPGERATGG